MEDPFSQIWSHMCTGIIMVYIEIALLLGFEPDVGKFFFYMLVIALTASCASAQAFTVSACAPVTILAIEGTAALFITQVVRECCVYVGMHLRVQTV